MATIQVTLNEAEARALRILVRHYHKKSIRNIESLRQKFGAAAHTGRNERGMATMRVLYSKLGGNLATIDTDYEEF